MTDDRESMLLALLRRDAVVWHRRVVSQRLALAPKSGAVEQATRHEIMRGLGARLHDQPLRMASMGERSAETQGQRERRARG